MSSTHRHVFDNDYAVLLASGPPGKSTYRLMLPVRHAATDRGVKIRALTNSLASNNHIPAHTAYRHRRKQIVEAGVDLHELRPDPADRKHFEAPGFGAEIVRLPPVSG